MKIAVIIFLVVPLFLFSQEETSLEQIDQQNSMIKELNLLYAETDIFNLNPDVLEAEQGVQYLMPTAKILFSDVRLLPEVSEHLARSILNYRNDLTTLTQFGFRMNGSIAGGFGPPIAGVPPSEVFIQTPGQLQEYLNHLESEINFRIVDQTGQESWDTLSFEFQSALVKYLMGCLKVETVLEEFTSAQKVNFSAEESVTDVYSKLIEPWEKRQLMSFEIIESMEELDLTKLAFASRILNENLRSLIRLPMQEVNIQNFEIETKYGLIGIFGAENDTISKNYFISVDFGGDDLYTNNCGSNLPLVNHIGLLIDYSGDDVYESDFVNAGILGLSYLLDFEGNDEYKNFNSGLAFSLFGASYFVDLHGDDRYVSSGNYSQASSIAGVSVMVDQKGDDFYFCSSFSQGFGATLGCGIFADITGHDVYRGSQPEEIQAAPANFIQGASRGRWAEATDGQSLAGGFGIFIDGAGTDSFSAGSFSQGAGYYFGTGMFNDFSGNDKYNATSHSQGYSAHFSLGNFCEVEGDDTYNADTDKSQITQIIGSGRDNSCGLFLDKAGNDTYYFGNRSAGVGDMRGFGCFVDDSGENTFFWISNDTNANSPSLGKAVSLQNPANEFRLFSNTLNWNTGVFLTKNSSNRFYKVYDSESSEIQFSNELFLDSLLKTSQIFLIRD